MVDANEIHGQGHRWLSQETRALLTRLDRVRPFALQETMVPAAAPSLVAQTAIERYLTEGRQRLRGLARAYLRWLHSAGGRQATLPEAQRRYTFLRLRFNTVLSHFDIFADMMTQRSEAETGVWLGGLDALAADALVIPGRFFDPPPVVCYLDRGHGAAIRRARTRLPGGGENPVAIVRVPRERMVSNGIASSLVHEVGHQGSVLLDLITSLRRPLGRLEKGGKGQKQVWMLFNRWISEILADFWSVSRMGISSTLGLMGVVSLPRPFVFRIGLDDPHPIPWVRVKLSCAMGKGLYPHAQWDQVAAVWEGYYPPGGIAASSRRILADVEAAIPDFVDLLLDHQPASLQGYSLGDIMRAPERHPEQLRILFQRWGGRARRMRNAPPSLAFAAIGQARADGIMTPEDEARTLSWLLTYWALRHTLNASEVCAAQTQAGNIALAA
jgi:hypothetical protein